LHLDSSRRLEVVQLVHSSSVCGSFGGLLSPFSIRSLGISAVSVQLD
jgi:hypothetical protein